MSHYPHNYDNHDSYDTESTISPPPDPNYAYPYSRPFSPITEEPDPYPQHTAPSEWSSSNTIVSGVSGSANAVGLGARPLPSPARGFRHRYVQRQQPTPAPMIDTSLPHISHSPPYSRDSSPPSIRHGSPYDETATPFGDNSLPLMENHHEEIVSNRDSLEDHEEPNYPLDYMPEDQRSLGKFDSQSFEYDPESNNDDSDEDENAINTQHYGPAPAQRQERRLKLEKKQVKLTHGNLVLDCPVPSKLLSFLPKRDNQEFTHMRYTAATCDPDNFMQENYTLRPQLYARETELFVVVTCYNENEILMTRTLHGLMKNIAHLCSRTRSRMWGKDGWKKVVVCIVADGRHKVHPRVLDVLAAMGVYQEGIAKNFVDKKQVQAHIYEYTSQISVDSDLRFKGAEKGIVPVQIIFCLKEKNAKKLNSHRWFFNAFGPILKPTVCVLIDVGTRPGPKSIYHLWKCFDLNSNVAGACGEIQAMKGRYWKSLLNPVVGAQNFEYKISNILDKPLESTFGYITVLPGAFSAYRYHALQNDKYGNGPLASYFKGETLHGRDADVFTANMYLAEDRILCFELIAKRNESWKLQYVRAARGETDVPDNISEFIAQRRRWLNGSFFAGVYSISHIGQIFTTSHTSTRKIAFLIESAYNAMSLILGWFGLANYYLTFYYVAMSLSDSEWGQKISSILQFSLFLLIAMQFILSLGNRPQGSRRLYFFSIAFLSFIQIYLFFATVYLTVRGVNTAMKEAGTGDGLSWQLFSNSTFRDIFVSTIATFGVYWIMSILYMDPWHMVTSFQSYMLLMPAYIIVLTTYAYCNTHDVSWGTKGEDKVNTDLGEAVSAPADKIGGSSDEVEILVPTGEQDVNSGYENSLLNLRERRPVPESGPDARTVQEDYYKEIRTRLVLAWLVSNAIFVMIVTSTQAPGDISGLKGSNIYLRVLLWIVAAMTIFRAIGSLIYLSVQAIEFAARRQGGHAGSKTNYVGSSALYKGVTPTPSATTTKPGMQRMLNEDLEKGYDQEGEEEEEEWNANASFDEGDDKLWNDEEEENEMEHNRVKNEHDEEEEEHNNHDGGYNYKYGYGRHT